MCQPNNHNFKTNLDNLENLTSISPYVTVIFCSKCGFIIHNKNTSSIKALLNEEG